jgi:hypothetical protein
MIYKFKDLEFELLYYIIIVDDKQELFEFDKTHNFDTYSRLQEIPTSDGVVFSDLQNNDGIKSIVICFKPKYINGEIKYFLRLVSHECIHITFRRFSDLGLADKLKSKQEFSSYFTWVYENILVQLWKYRK